MSKYESYILTKYNNGVERLHIAEDLCMEHGITLKEAEELVEAMILRRKNMKNKAKI